MPRKSLINSVAPLRKTSPSGDPPVLQSSTIFKKASHVMQTLLDATAGIVVLVDRDGKLLAMNRTAAVLGGKSVSELIGQDVYSLFPHAKPNKYRIDEVIRTKQPLQFQDRLHGRIFEHAIWPVFDDEKEVVSLAMFVRDRTEELGLMQDLKAANEMLRAIAHTDDLTGLPNRRHFLDALHKEFHRIRRHGGNSAVALLDVDHFKTHNDTRGHIFGDQVLVELASILRTEMRQSDSIARYGGDEFVILMPQTSVETAAHALERIRQRAQRGTLGEAGQRIAIQFSAGLIRLGGSDQTSPEDALHRVDTVLYQAKADGRNCTRIG